LLFSSLPFASVFTIPKLLDFRFACVRPSFTAITDDWLNACHVQLEPDGRPEVAVVSEER
jgi:hypothetical protein